MKEEKSEMRGTKKEPLQAKNVETAEWGTKDQSLRKTRCFSKSEE